LSQGTAAVGGYVRTLLHVLHKLTESNNESCLLAVPDGTEAVTVHTVDGPEFRQTTDPGDRLPLHVSSMGKAMLAAMPDQMAEEMISQLDLQAYTEYTVTDPQVLEQQVAAGR